MLTLNLNLKSRFRNKAFILSMVGAVVLLIQQLGFTFIPANYSDVVNSILTILTMIGIVVDPSTSGVSDVVSTIVEPVQAVSEPVVSEEVADNTNVVDAEKVSLQAENEQLKAQVAQVKSVLTSNANVNSENLPTM